MAINLNTASKEELKRLSGVDDELADRIVSYRESLGGQFNSVDDLRQVPGVTDEVLQDVQKGKAEIK